MVAQKSEQLKVAILCKFSDTLEAQRNSLWALPKQILNDTSRPEGVPKKASLKEYQVDDKYGRGVRRSDLT